MLRFGKSANINNLATLTISAKQITRFEWCLYSGNKLVCGKQLVNDLEDRKRKFFISVSNVLTNGKGLSEVSFLKY